MAATKQAERDFWRGVRAAHPPLREAIVADALLTMRLRGEGHDFTSRYDTLRQIVRLAWQSDAFLGQSLYRLKARLQAWRIPLAPRIAHHLAQASAQISIGDPVVVESGVYLMHGQVVIDGVSRVGAGTVVAPFVTIGLRSGSYEGPTIEAGVQIGTGAKILGSVRIGAGAQVGANAVVLDDVEPGATVVGVPARRV